MKYNNEANDQLLEIATYANDPTALKDAYAIAAMALRTQRESYDVRALVADVLADLATGDTPRRGALVDQVRREIRRRACATKTRAARTVWIEDVPEDHPAFVENVTPPEEIETGADRALLAIVLVPGLRALLAADTHALALLDAYAAGIVQRAETMQLTGMTATEHKNARKRLQQAARRLAETWANGSRDADERQRRLVAVKLGPALTQARAANSELSRESRRSVG